MITLSELQQKEVVMMESGERLGYITDLEIDETNGMIIAIIISYRQANGSFFQRTQERLIPWQQIAIIGTDIILIKDNPLPQEAKEKTQEIYSMNEES